MCEDEVPVHRHEWIGEAMLLRFDRIVDLVENGDQASFHAENCVRVQIRTIRRENMGRDRVKAVCADDKVDMSGAIGMTAERLQEPADRPIIRNRIVPWFGRAKPEAAVRVGREYAAKVHFRLDALLLNAVKTVFIGLPDV